MGLTKLEEAVLREVPENDPIHPDVLVVKLRMRGMKDARTARATYFSLLRKEVLVFTTPERYLIRKTSNRGYMTTRGFDLNPDAEPTS